MATYLVQYTIHPEPRQVYEVSEAEYQRALALGIVVNAPASPQPPDVFDDEVAELFAPESTSATSAAARAVLVPFWKAAETVTASTIRMAPTGETIKRTADGTTRATYDATEQAAWTVVSSGGGSAPDATDTTKGVLKLAGDLAGTADVPTVPGLATINTELGADPSGPQATVAARFTVVEDRVTAVEGATSTAGVEVGSAELTVDYDILGQAGGNTVFADVGLSIAVPAQTRAYNAWFGCTVVIATNASFAGPKYLSAVFRIVNSGVTEVLDVSQIPVIIPVSGAGTYFAKALIKGRVAAGRAATTWKVQARLSPVPDANVTTFAVYAGPALGAPAGGVSRAPATLQAVTV